MMKFGLAGNPNSGKTTLFNSLTGSTAHVGNWPGVTVDKREGMYRYSDEKINIVDLPGIYSLSPYSPEEIVTRNFILDESPDCIINVVDATNLERNLYLTTQLLEIEVPVVIALNMMDVIRHRGDVLNPNDLSQTFGVPVVEISALKSDGLKELIKVSIEAANKKRAAFTPLKESKIANLVSEITEKLKSENVSNPLFHAVKLIETDEFEIETHREIAILSEELKKKIPEDVFEGDYEGIIADARYCFITNHFRKTIAKKDLSNLTKSDKIDKVMTHRIWSIPIFLVIMFVVFHIVFSEDLLFLNSLFGLRITNPGLIDFLTGMGYNTILEETDSGCIAALQGIPSLGVFLQNWMGFLTGLVINWFAGFMPEGMWYTGLICDGVLTGLDSIFSFVPQILLLFLFIAILEDSGYMARVAFIMDRAFRKFGLSGKAFIPLLMGFGCSVPAMMATKALEDEKERDLTIRLSPFFSCGAKAPIWAMLAVVVAGNIMGDIFVFSIYLLGILLAIVSATFIKLFSKEKSMPPFIMELPEYHLPQFKSLIIRLWDKFKHFVEKASTIIAASIIVIWFLSNFKWAFWQGMVDITESMLADIGKVLQYIFYPLGFSQGSEGWKYSVATVTGLIAKEEVVATLASLGITSETMVLSTPAIYSFAIYNLITVPCFAAVSTAKSESTKKGFIITILWWIFASYISSFIIYRLGVLLESSIVDGLLGIFVVITIIALVGSIINLNRKQKA